MTGLKAIETVFDGYRFRSRLEARWAVFFKTLGVPYEYEPQGFTLPNGQRYLPDFRVSLKDKILWAEVKPAEQTNKKFEVFMDAICDDGFKHAYNVCGTILHEIPLPEDVRHGWHGSGDDFECWFGIGSEGCGWDNNYQFCVCEECGGVGFEFGGRSNRIRCGCHTQHEDRGDIGNRVFDAFRAARTARFEHGEHPYSHNPVFRMAADFVQACPDVTIENHARLVKDYLSNLGITVEEMIRAGVLRRP